MVAVGDQRRAVEPAARSQPDHGGDLVADEADRRPPPPAPRDGRAPPGGSVARSSRTTATQALTKIVSDDEVARRTSRPSRSQQEGDAERYGGQRVAEVVDQVGEQRDAAARDEDATWAAPSTVSTARLTSTARTPARERDDRSINEAMRVAVTSIVIVTMPQFVAVHVGGYKGLRPTRPRQVPVLPAVRVAMDMAPVPGV